MKKTAFLFPGQGSQKVGMGQDIHDTWEIARNLFDLAEEITRLPVKKMCFEGPMDLLTQTVNLQPAVTAVNLAFLAILRQEGFMPGFAAGHSLGEYSALCATGVLSESDTLRIVLNRGELMHREASRQKGGMSAIIGLAIEDVESLVSKGLEMGTVAVANHNMEKQIVITGSPEPVRLVSDLAKSAGAKAIPLKVSGAWHSELIRGSVADFKPLLAEVPFSAPKLPIVMNVSAQFCTNPDEIREIMADQLCSPVRWYDIVRKLLAERVDTFVEVGPGKVLSGLLKKIIPKEYPCRVHNVNDLKSLESFLNRPSQ